MSSSRSLAGRALIALGLMVGFYALAITILAVLLYIPYAEWTYAGRLHLKLTFVCIVGAGIILWSIVPRRDRFDPPGPRLEAAEHPRLFGKLTGIAKTVGQPMPAEVYLVPEVNAWVAQRGGIMGLGSRRVMGLGLPLLPVLTISQLEAVLAHEFGHYHGGDTKLAPWVYKTRVAISRTLQELAKRKSILIYPFLWYGNMFLRVTHAISRAQEYSADELAARTVGAESLIDGLKAIHKAAMAFEPYWTSEVGPVLDAGFRPPLAEGFSRFLASASVQEAVSQGLEQELTNVGPDPYDTHPPLPDRISALKRLAQGKRPVQKLPAISLLENVPELDALLLNAILGDGTKVGALKPTKWEEVGRQVLLPLWEGVVRKHGSALTGMTPGSLPEISGNLVEFATKLGFRAGAAPVSVEPTAEDASPDELVLLDLQQRSTISSEEIKQRAAGILAIALALTLSKTGWSLHAMPGELYFQRGDKSIEPFLVIDQLASGKLKAETWQQQCEEAGISRLDLAAIMTDTERS